MTRSFDLTMAEDPIASGCDGLSGNAIFCAWTGHNPLSPQRAEALLSIYRETCCPVLLLTPHTIPRWEVKDSPFHPAYPHLSETHKADYLRCYFMHHFGGGYTDIKMTSQPWTVHFEALRAAPDAYGIGYPEIGPHGVATCGGALEAELKQNWTRLIGNCAYIFRKNTPFTQAWLARTHAVLDAKLDAVMAHPSQHPLDQAGVILPDGTTSLYPFRWQEILGEIFHPLAYEFSDRLLQTAMAPRFTNYR